MSVIGNSNLRARTIVRFLVLMSSMGLLTVTGVFTSTCGTASEPCEITTENDLKSVASKGLGLHYELKNDILIKPADVPHNFEPIGDFFNRFSGVFDGGGNTIHDLHIYHSGERYQGLFGYASGNAVICNLVLENPKVTGSHRVGSLAGSILGNGVEIDVIIKYPSLTGYVDVGGLVGRFQGRINSPI